MKKVREQVFLSYAHDDLSVARKLYRGLTERGIKIWFDKKELGPGPWKSQIERAITRSRYFVICISTKALERLDDQPGFQDNELNEAYRIAQAQPNSAFTIIPVRLDDCNRGDHRISVYQQYDLFNNWENEIEVLAEHLGSLGSIITDDSNVNRNGIVTTDGSSLAELFEFYYEYLKPILGTVEDIGMRAEISYEIFAAFDHVSRHWGYGEEESDVAIKGMAHLRRACFDTLKLALIRTVKEREQLRKINTHSIDGGEFDSRAATLYQQINQSAEKARIAESDGDFNESFSSWTDVFVKCQTFHNEFFLSPKVDRIRLGL